MPDWLLIILSDIKELFIQAKIDDFATPVGIFLWVLILLVPLRSIDRRDFITGLSYILFSMIAGIALILVLPSKFGFAIKPQAQFVIISTIFVVTVLRWTVKEDEQANVTEELVIDSKPSEGS